MSRDQYERNVMMRCLVPVIVAVIIGLGFAGNPAAADPSLRIATKEAPPFAMKDAEGNWTGISITLWRAVATSLRLKFAFVETDLKGMLDGVTSGRYDAGVAAVSMTAERDERMDFSHPFFSTGLGIAVVKNGNMSSMLATLPWRNIGYALLLITALMILSGLLIWLTERRVNPDHFGNGTARGIGAGLWWSAVTMMTVGYGDKTPQSVLGRMIAIVWMLASLLIVTSFSATITSSLTVNEMNSSPLDPEDLNRQRVGSVPNTSSAAYLSERHIVRHDFPTVKDGLTALVGKQIDAFVYDRPLLQYWSLQLGDGKITLLPFSFAKQQYAIALPKHSLYREQINKAMLAYMETPEWQALLVRYLGAVD